MGKAAVKKNNSYPRPWSGKSSGGDPRQKRTKDTPQGYFLGHCELLRIAKAKRIAKANAAARSAAGKKTVEKGHSGNPKLLEMVAAELTNSATPTEDTKVAAATTEA